MCRDGEEQGKKGWVEVKGRRSREKREIVNGVDKTANMDNLNKRDSTLSQKKQMLLYWNLTLKGKIIL